MSSVRRGSMPSTAHRRIVGDAPVSLVRELDAAR
jgi:hypothetical protein